MKTYFFMMISIIIGLSACDKETSTGLQKQEKDKLIKMRQEIQNMVDTVACTDASTWSFTAIGNKACGGPVGYIAYPHSIDTTLFNELVEKYTEAEKSYNMTYKIISDCSFQTPPAAVFCVDGKPNFIYKEI